MTDEEETDSESESEKAPPAKKPKIDDEGSKSESVRDPDIRYKPPSYLSKSQTLPSSTNRSPLAEPELLTRSPASWKLRPLTLIR